MRCVSTRNRSAVSSADPFRRSRKGTGKRQLTAERLSTLEEQPASQLDVWRMKKERHEQIMLGQKTSMT